MPKVSSHPPLIPKPVSDSETQPTASPSPSVRPPSPDTLEQNLQSSKPSADKASPLTKPPVRSTQAHAANPSAPALTPQLNDELQLLSNPFAKLATFLGLGPDLNSQVNQRVDLAGPLHEARLTEAANQTTTPADVGRLDALRIHSHLAGIGGNVSVNGNKIALEGLRPSEARRCLDPAVVKSLELARVLIPMDTSPETVGMARALETLTQAWDKVDSFSQFQHGVTQIQRGNQKLAVWITGWRKPSGHAVGIVAAKEKGATVVYLCNPGNLRAERSVTRCEIRDQNTFSNWMSATRRDHDGALVRKLWSDGPQVAGLKPSGALPEEVDRIPQKRGNCPIASRKSCLLAGLWATMKPEGMSDATVKQTYKMLTTLLRQQGVSQLVKDGHPEILGKTLRSMISKSDRPDCLRMAYQVADALAEHYGMLPLGANYAKLGTDELQSNSYLTHLKNVVTAARVDLTSPAEDGLTLSKRAQLQGRNQVSKILEFLI